MAKKKISDLPAGSALTGIELVPIVQSGTTKRITAQDIADLSNASSIGGGGTANYVSKFTTEFNIGDSQIFDNGTSVGIATDTPNASYKLDVNGSLKATSIVKSGGTSAEYLKADGSVSTLTNPITGTGTTNYLPKFTGSSALGNSQIFDNGTSVGIGTASPAYKFSIEGTAANIFITQNTSSTSFNRSYFFNNNGIGTQFLNFGSAYAFGTEFGVGQNGSVLQSNTTSAFAIGTSTATPLYLGTNATERMRIFSNGNIGINTTTDAGYKLDVNGTARVSGNINITKTTGNPAYIEVAANGNTIGTTSMMYGQDSGNFGYVWNRANASVYFGTNNTLKATLNAAGNLGLGITPSTATGFIYIQFGAGAALSTNNTNNSNFYHNTTFDASGNTLYAVTGQQSSYYRQINGLHAWATAPSGTAGNAITFTTNMVLDASGRLGIGTTSPSQKLHLYTASASTLYTRIENANGNTYLGLSAGGDTILSADTAGNKLFFYTEATERMRITGANVLIGTTTDNGAKLQVNGAISIGNTVSTAVSVMSTHKVQIVINGTTYYLLATT